MNTCSGDPTFNKCVKCEITGLLECKCGNTQKPCDSKSHLPKCLLPDGAPLVVEDENATCQVTCEISNI